MPHAHTTTDGSLALAHGCEIRQARERLGVTQREFARLGVAVETYRIWDSGRQVPPSTVLQKAHALVRTRHISQLMNLDTLGRLLTIHPRTLRQAARTGRLTVSYDTRTFCRVPITKTQMFNGYAEQVAGMYAGMDLRRNF